MFEKHPNRVMFQLACEFTPIITFSTKLTEIGERMQKVTAAKHWSTGFGRVAIRDTERRAIFTADHRHLAYSAFGHKVWADCNRAVSEEFVAALMAMKIQQVVRLSFEVMLFLANGMSHSEWFDLLFGSVLPPRPDFSWLQFPRLTDGTCTIHAEEDGDAFRLSVNPLTTEQCETFLTTVPQLPTFFEEQNSDPALHEFRRQFSRDCLLIHVNGERHSLSVPTIPTAVGSLARKAELSIGRIVDRILATKTTKG